MSMDLYESLVLQIKDFLPLFGACLYLGGEPLLHKQLENMIELARRHGIQYGISTNGSLLSKERAVSLVDAGLGGVRIDFSADKEKYEEACPGGHWERVLENIRYLAEYRDRANPRFSIIVKDLCTDAIVSDKARETSMQKLRNLFSGVSIDKFDTFELHNWSGEFATQQIDQGFPENRLNSSPCSHLWFSLNIRFDGQVVPCCRDLRGDVIIGDATKESLVDIWNGENLQRMRDLHCRRRYQDISLCRNCDRIWTGGKRGGSISAMFQKFLHRRKRA